VPRARYAAGGGGGGGFGGLGGGGFGGFGGSMGQPIPSYGRPELYSLHSPEGRKTDALEEIRWIKA